MLHIIHHIFITIFKSSFLFSILSMLIVLNQNISMTIHFIHYNFFHFNHCTLITVTLFMHSKSSYHITFTINFMISHLLIASFKRCLSSELQLLIIWPGSENYLSDLCDLFIEWNLSYVVLRLYCQWSSKIFHIVYYFEWTSIYQRQILILIITIS